ncbi:IclR family transcriptional regulator [Sulfurospirillum sp. 1307]
MSQNKSLSKGLSILKEIMTSSEPLNATKLSLKLNIDKSTMSRLITTLMKEEFIEYKEGSKEIILSDLMRRLSQKQSREKLIQKTNKLLDEIFYLTNEASYLGILDNNSVLYLNQVDKSNRVLKTRNSVGLHAPLHTNAFGKIILANCDIDLNSLNLKKFTAKTISSVSRLKKEIDIINKQGYAIGDEEHEYGLKSLAVAYFNNLGEFAGVVGISGLSIRLDNALLHQWGKKILELTKR